jgi:hypothetical protein
VDGACMQKKDRNMNIGKTKKDNLDLFLIEIKKSIIEISEKT